MQKCEEHRFVVEHTCVVGLQLAVWQLPALHCELSSHPTHVVPLRQKLALQWVEYEQRWAPEHAAVPHGGRFVQSAPLMQPTQWPARQTSVPLQRVSSMASE
jgi:hypothetical protein